MSIQAQTVSQIIGQIKTSLEGQFRAITVTGEVTNLSPSAAGHWYFTLSDANSSISVALFKMDALRNPIIKNVKNGDQIVITGPISVYPKRGSFQLLAKKLTTIGKGNLVLQYEKLKEKLTREGLFDLTVKQSLIKFPKKIAVITALKGAALQDFLNVMKRRSYWGDILIIPAVVQGDASAKTLIEALQKAQGVGDVDIIVLTRGGGAIEDLWSFNDENLVREIYKCFIPVVSAVGHQVDYTLCDFVSDLRCETPTAAAEILTQPYTEINQRISFVGHKLKNLLYRQHSQIDKRLKRISPIHVLHILKQKLFKAEAIINEFQLKNRAFELTGIYDKQMQLDDLVERMKNAIDQSCKKYTHKLEIVETKISGLNPKGILDRGYSIIQDSENNVITNIKKFNKIEKNKKVSIQFSDGTAELLKDY
jgi:exodeoxyribonuclease VII large subunit